MTDISIQHFSTEVSTYWDQLLISKSASHMRDTSQSNIVSYDPDDVTGPGCGGISIKTYTLYFAGSTRNLYSQPETGYFSWLILDSMTGALLIQGTASVPKTYPMILVEFEGLKNGLFAAISCDIKYLQIRGTSALLFSKFPEIIIGNAGGLFRTVFIKNVEEYMSSILQLFLHFEKYDFDLISFDNNKRVQDMANNENFGFGSNSGGVGGRHHHHHHRGNRDGHNNSQHRGEGGGGSSGRSSGGGNSSNDNSNHGFIQSSSSSSYQGGGGGRRNSNNNNANLYK